MTGANGCTVFDWCTVEHRPNDWVDVEGDPARPHSLEAASALKDLFIPALTVDEIRTRDGVRFGRVEITYNELGATTDVATAIEALHALIAVLPRWRDALADVEQHAGAEVPS